MEVLRERLPRLSPPEADGSRSVEENLTDFARQATAFYAESFPIAASLHADPHLKARHYDAMRALRAGPHAPVYALDAYLRAEQQAGRIGAGADTSPPPPSCSAPASTAPWRTRPCRRANHRSTPGSSRSG